MAGLQAQGITVRFGGLVAVDGVDLDAQPGQITALIGPNGAGKTTTFNVCCGFQPAQSGRVFLGGRDVTGLSPAARARAGLGRTFQRMELFGSLTVRENIELAVESTLVGPDPLTQLGLRRGGARARAAVRRRADEVIGEVGIGSFAGDSAGEISTGQGRLVELARALAREPTVLLLDEPSSGLDHRESEDFGRQLQRVVAARGIAILMVEHDMSLVLNVCSRIFVLDFGKPLMEGTPDEVRASEEVRAAYLGRAA